MRIEGPVLREVRKHAEEAYPYEGCGVLGGKGDLVTRFVPVENVARDEGFDVFMMDPEGQLAAFESLEGGDRAVVGFYHSHPDHDAYFSARDEDSATADGEPLFPDKSYLVISVRGGRFSGLGAFRWRDGFEAEDVVEV